MDSNDLCVCKKCGQQKELAMFGKHSIAKSGRRGVCKACLSARICEWQRKNAAKINAYQRAYRAKHPDKHKAWNAKSAKRWRANNPADAKERDLKSDLKKHYGVTPEWYRETLAAQGGVCAICGNPPSQKRLAVDHCHDSLKIRALLCSQCNVALHKMERDIEWIRKAEAYLQKHGAMG